LSQERSRRRIIEAALGVVLLLAAGSLAVSSSGRPVSVTPPAPSPTQSVAPTQPIAPTQSTLLIELRGDTGTGVADVVTGVGGPADRAIWVTIDPRLEVEVPGTGAVSLGSAAVIPGLETTRRAISDLVGVRIDGTWTLGRLALAGLIDAVGGVTIDVPDLVVLTPGNTTAKIMIPAGVNRLEGAVAALYVTTLEPGETEAGRIARAASVLNQLIMSLPIDPVRIRQILGSLGALSQTDLSADQLSNYLARMRSDMVSASFVQQPLPTFPIILSKPPLVRLDVVNSEKLIALFLPLAVRRPGPDSPIRVLVQTGIGTPGLTGGVSDRLAAVGLAYVNGRAAASFGFVASQVLVPDGSAESRGWGDSVAKALALPAWDVRVVGHPIVGGDVQVIIGADYHP
jgi:hypothetical protein